MSNREWVAVPGMYLDLSTVLGGLLDDRSIRDIACVARDRMAMALAALSFQAPRFSLATSVFVRDTLIAPNDFVPCAITAARGDVFAIPQLTGEGHSDKDHNALQSYVGCAVLDGQSQCIGVFYLMDTKPRRLTAAEMSRLRRLSRLVSSQIEIVRRFGIRAPNPSPREIIRRADLLASMGQQHEARDLIALAYAAHDIAGIRQRTADRMPG